MLSLGQAAQELGVDDEAVSLARHVLSQMGLPEPQIKIVADIESVGGRDVAGLFNFDTQEIFFNRRVFMSVEIPQRNFHFLHEVFHFVEQKNSEHETDKNVAWMMVEWNMTLPKRLNPAIIRDAMPWVGQTWIE